MSKLMSLLTSLGTIGISKCTCQCYLNSTNFQRQVLSLSEKELTFLKPEKASFTFKKSESLSYFSVRLSDTSNTNAWGDGHDRKIIKKLGWL